ncbi:hypothetical protein B0H66DRAFT_273721 [Apodospora peruviana]|uniref:Gfo/Idh/MocA-like oxidoreductase N-terminal domain-containing protein n=1 Tax=Apodospora peruviana TaxID=516989 RepID=A0AAE0HZW2_9PEZI|nr:hypothetical protein B0H66DRAFT_273721 [Apodospora peruviana]
MAPLRVALIGLSSSAKTSWASGAHLPYLVSARGQSKFKIVALLNSSVDAAKAAIAAYNLPAETKAYGDPAALAADKDIDLVVCNTRVDKHHETIRPSIAAGQNVYCEWPLGKNDSQARDLVELARQSGSKTMVGLQGRLAPLALKVREIIESGRIGKVLSSECRGYGGTIDRQAVPEGLKYFYVREVGGNPFTIRIGHTFDFLQSVLGEASPVKGHFQVQRPEGKVFDPVTRAPLETINSDVPDLVIITGTLAESEFVQKNATIHLSYRRGQTFPGEPELVWNVNGEKGEIRVTSPSSAALQVLPGSEMPVIEVHDFETGKVDKVDWEHGWQDWQEGLDMRSRNVGALYEAFAEGGKYPTFEDALKRHEQLEGLWADWKA